MSITVLLGAGASADAGIPMSIQLTSRLLDEIHFESKPILTFVYGRLLTQEAAKAHANGYYMRRIAIDAEALFNAVEVLRDREALDAAPFCGELASPY